MAIHATGSLTPAALVSPAGAVLLRIRVRLAAPRLDARLAGGEDPAGDATLARRSHQLVSRLVRRRTAAAVQRLLSGPPARVGFSASVPVSWKPVEIAQPALEQLVAALRARESVRPRGVALTRLLLTDGSGPLYRPVSPDALHESAREALFALGPDRAADWSSEGC